MPCHCETNVDVDLGRVDEIIARTGRGREALIPILQGIQEAYGYLPQAALRRVCELTESRPADVAGVSTFYTQFRHQPVGRHMISVCHGTACHVKGSQNVHNAIRRHLDLSDDEETDAGKLFTIQKVACLGCCTLAPAVQIDEVTYGHLTQDKVPGMLADFLALQQRRGKSRKAVTQATAEGGGEIRIGLGSCCVSRGSGKLHTALTDALADLALPVRLKRVGCVGMCHQTPLLEIVTGQGQSFFYAQVEPEDAKAILLRHFRPGLTRRVRAAVSAGLDRWLTDANSGAVTRYSIDVRDRPVADFLEKQKHIATEHCGQIDPTDLEEYRRRGGFESLRRCAEQMSPAQVIEQVRRSGLRGRGGAGYSTGLKWQQVRQAGQEPYIICNGDEGDPGAFMDRMLLESYPYRIIEGMAIAAYAVGATQGYLYIRAEYPLAVRRVREALGRCEQAGLLGEKILGSSLCLQLKIMQGAGAFVCGEESALIASIEGQRGMPRLRPPYPAQEGLWGRPTLVNNVETYACVPWVMQHGADAFAALGTAQSSGTKVFALAGRVARGGLIEVAMGVTLREIVEEIGGGIAGGGRFKAVQVGGPSGGCVPARLADTPVDYEALTSAGAIMGSGGLVVLDDSDCMVDMARYFLEFTQNQSCGKCTFCRVGTRRMLDILERLCTGQGQGGDLDELEQLAHQVQRGSLCGLGRTAPNPVLSTLQYFREEYEAHLAGCCPAGRCVGLIRYTINEQCIGCTLCAQQCPVGAIEAKPYEQHEIDQEKCTRCGTCKAVCPAEAVEVH